jgi:hypothetical protein
MAIQKNNKKIYVTGGIILAVAGLGYLFRKQIKNYFVPELMPSEYDGDVSPDFLLPQDPGTVVIDNSSAVAPVVDDNKIDIDRKIKKGEINENVRSLQYNIREIQNILGAKKFIIADANFGAETHKALLKLSNFYKKNNYWTIRKARETVARYAGEKSMNFPQYLKNANNYNDLLKIYQASYVSTINK